MKLVITTQINMQADQKTALTELMDQFDPSFSKRYWKDIEIIGVGTHHDFSGENHPDRNRYNIFYADGREENVAVLVEKMKQGGICEIIAPVDDNHQMVNVPLYAAGLYGVSTDFIPETVKKPEGFNFK